jgi:hypothetical protein
VAPATDWVFTDNGSPGEFAAFAANLEPNVGGPETDLFLFEFYWNGGDGGRVGTFKFGTGGDANFATCSRCFFIHSSDKDLLAASGVLEIDADSTPIDGVIHATLRDATFVEVTIDPTTLVSTPVPNGLCARVEMLELTFPP